MVPFAPGHCGPYTEGDGDAEDDVVGVCVDIVAPDVAVEPRDEPVDDIPVDWVITIIPATSPAFPGV